MYLCGEIKHLQCVIEGKPIVRSLRGTRYESAAVTGIQPETRRSNLGQDETEPKVLWRSEAVLRACVRQILG